jgi:hypothetical protein
MDCPRLSAPKQADWSTSGRGSACNERSPSCAWHVTDQHHLTRSQFERWFINRDVSLVIREACGFAHHSARWLNGLGVELKLRAKHETAVRREFRCPM